MVVVMMLSFRYYGGYVRFTVAAPIVQIVQRMSRKIYNMRHRNRNNRYFISGPEYDNRGSIMYYLNNILLTNSRIKGSDQKEP